MSLQVAAVPLRPVALPPRRGRRQVRAAAGLPARQLGTRAILVMATRRDNDSSENLRGAAELMKFTSGETSQQRWKKIGRAGADHRAWRTEQF